MQADRFNTGFELKFVAETGLFEGYASVFNVTDSTGDVILPGAFAKTLDKARLEGRLPPMLWQHDPAQPIGVWRDLHEDGHGLFVRGELFVQDIPLAREACKLLKEDVVTGLSIGYRAREARRDVQNGLRVLAEVELIEISMVTFPANDFARIRRVKSQMAAGLAPTERDCEAVLREAGFSRKMAKGFVAQGYKALMPGTRDATALADEDTDGAMVLAAALADLTATIRAMT